MGLGGEDVIFSFTRNEKMGIETERVTSTTSQ